MNELEHVLFSIKLSYTVNGYQLYQLQQNTF